MLAVQTFPEDIPKFSVLKTGSWKTFGCTLALNVLVWNGVFNELLCGLSWMAHTQPPVLSVGWQVSAQHNRWTVVDLPQFSVFSCILSSSDSWTCFQDASGWSKFFLYKLLTQTLLLRVQERFSTDGSSVFVHGSTWVYQSLPDLPGGLVPSNTGSDSLSLQLYLRNLWVDRIPGLPDLVWSGCEAPGNISCFVGITPVHSQRAPQLLMEGTKLD